MGNATQRKLAARGPHDRSTVRTLEPITDVVSEAHIIEVATVAPQHRGTPARRRQSPRLNDLVSQTFFADGQRQEATGIYSETAHVRIRSLDRVPRRWWPMMLVFCLFTTAAGAGAWWLGFRPPAAWQHTRAWQALHLPPMPTPAQPRWRS
jgi:hypothetical protein